MRQLQGAWVSLRVFNTPTPGLYRHDVESGTTWAGVATEKAKERYFVDGKKTNTIVVGLVRVYEGTGTLGEYGMLFYIEHVCVLKRKRRTKLKKSIQGNKRNMTKTYKTYHRVRVKTESKRILIVSDLKPDILFLNEVNANTV